MPADIAVEKTGQPTERAARVAGDLGPDVPCTAQSHFRDALERHGAAAAGLHQAFRDALQAQLPCQSDSAQDSDGRPHQDRHVGGDRLKAQLHSQIDPTEDH